MKRVGVTVIIGLALILLGVLFLLDTTKVISIDWEVIFPLLFGVGGLIFLGVFFGNTKEDWWAVIPGMTLIGLAGLMAIGIFLPESAGAWGAALFLAFIGLSFWVIYFTRKDAWWAIIPGGSLFSVALVAGLAETAGGMVSGGILFLGLALTFLLVYLLPNPEGRPGWALIPAGVLGVMGIIFMIFGGEWANFVWPVALIVGGGFLLWRAIVRKG